MLRKDYKKIQEQCQARLNPIRDKAAKAELYYVACFWESFFCSGKVECRVGYFEDTNEAEIFCNMLADKMLKRNFAFYITSNILDTEDGGLFDVHS